MESGQLKRISMIGLSILCLSPVEFFSNKLFENRKEEKVVLAINDTKLKPNYLSSNYEIFNPNIKTASELEKLASENKKKEISDTENKLESEEAKKEDKKEENNKESNKSSKKESPKEENKVVQEVVKTNSSTNNNVKKTTEETTVKNNVETTSNVAKPNTEIATNLINYAKQYVGYPYKSGGTDLNSGVDCSGFTMKVYEQFGYSLPHSSRSQSGYGQYVSINNLEIGDLVFYGYNGSISHVAIYIGNGQIVHATTNSGGIKIANLNVMPIITARRILTNS